MEKGTVSWFNESKGFGFINRDNGDGDIFVHFQDINMDGYKTLAKGERVEFLVDGSPKGDIARHVTKIED